MASQGAANGSSQSLRTPVSYGPSNGLPDQRNTAICDQAISEPPTPLMDVDLSQANNKRPLTPETPDNQGWSQIIYKKAPKKTRTAEPTITAVSNSFQPLVNAPATEPLPATPRARRPPPIVLDSKAYCASGIAKAIRSLGITNFRVHTTARGFNLYITDQTDYDKAKNAFVESQQSSHPVSFHTYAPKGSKPNKKFMIFGLDDDHCIPSITTALQHPDLIDVRRLTTMRDGIRVETATVLVTFKPDYDHTTHLMNIKHINNIIIRYKPFTPNMGQPICGRCQSIGHTKRYCWKPIRCVRCGGNHNVEACSPQTPPKCPNCNGDHPASYKNCPARVRLLQKAHARIPNPTPTQPIPRHPPPPPTNAWGPPLPTNRNAPTASQRLFPRSQNPPITNPQVPLPSIPIQETSESAPRWVSELTSSLTSILNTLISTVQTLLTTLPQMLTR